MAGHAWPKGLVKFPKAMCYVSNFHFFVLMKVHAGCSGLASVDTIDTRGM
jgi:hypothetical protein